MEKFDKIWLFVERELKTSVPTYIKNVLRVCGYNNGFTIASIDEEDLQYMQNEVRNGNVSKYFIGVEDEMILEGSPKAAKDFEFTMGHKNFLIYIVNFLKKHILENGMDSFTSEVTPMNVPMPKPLKTKLNAKTKTVPRKRMKYSQSPFFHLPNREPSPPQNTTVLSRDGVSIEKSNLLSKAITSLISHTPEMYVKARVKLFTRVHKLNFSFGDIETTNTKTSIDLVSIEIDTSTTETNAADKTIKYVGRIACPFCSKIIPVSHSSTPRSSGCPGKPWWNTSNFDSHLNIQHCFNFKGEEHIENINDEPSAELNMQKPQSNDRGSGSTKRHSGNVNGDSMLKNFMNSAERNSTRKKPGYRFDDLTKMFAAFMKMIAGLLAYETLHANFPLSLPSVSTVNRFLADNGPHIVEGEMRTDELLQYLQERNLPLEISMSEDGTRITSKISHDPKTNQLIGFSLPLETNGMPKVSSFPARNIREIQNHFNNTSNSISSTAYVQMAQPIEPNSSPFCLMIHSTDNKFTALNVLRRWRFQASKLKEKAIKLNNISTDGDTRTLMAMKVLSRIGQSNRAYLDCDWYSCGGYVVTTFTQDMVHIITKLRNRLLTCSRIFPIGNKIISFCHLKYLIENVSKDKHMLTRTDIEPKDRQNFLSADKVCSERTMQCLLEYVPGSEGTVIYLKVMRSILDAFSDVTLDSTERLFLTWYAVFICRAWRSWLLNSEKTKIAGQKRPKSFYNLKENFMSSNCYTCIELNAHALVKQVLIEDPIEDSFNDDSSEETDVEHSAEKLSSGKNNKFFFPNIFGSQVCESMFRQVRSFSSTFCTVVNFNILDIINRIRKLQLQNDIINVSNGSIKFPRFEKKAANMSEGLSQGSHRLDGLNRKSIISVIEKSKKAVITDLEKLGIKTSQLNFNCQVNAVFEEDLLDPDYELDCELDSDSEEMELRKEESGAEFLDIEAEEEDQEDINFLSGITGELMLKDYSIDHEYFDEESGSYVHLDEKGPLVLVTCNNGKEKVVRKSAVCNVLSKDKHKLSSDRLQRVQEKEYAMNISINKATPDADKFLVNEEIGLGDWCMFSERLNDDIRPIGPILIGLVLEFTYLKGNTFKEREYSKSLASVQPRPNGVGVGVLCSFYNFNDVGILTNVSGDKHKFVKIESYMGSIKQPIYEKKTLTISQKLIFEIQKLNDSLSDE